MPEHNNTITPTAASYHTEKPWWEKLRDIFFTPLGITVAVVAALVLLFILGLSLVAYAAGDVVSGTGALFAIFFLAGGGYYLVRFILNADHEDLSTATAYKNWQQWLATNYHLDLNDDQNNQLVNSVGGRATMQADGTWGSTYISRFGRVMTVRLSGNDADGYRLEHLKGRKFVPLREH